MYKALNDIRLSKNFRLSEFECHDGNHEVMIADGLVDAVQRLRDMLGKPITIAAAYRNKAHNAEIGGSPNSRHMKGEAVDVKVAGVDPLVVAQKGQACGFRGIGVYRNNGQLFTHLDIRQVPSYWHDNKGTHNLTAVDTLMKIPKK